MVYYVFLACCMIMYTNPPGMEPVCEEFCAEDLLEELTAARIKNCFICLIEGKKIRLSQIKDQIFQRYQDRMGKEKTWCTDIWFFVI